MQIGSVQISAETIGTLIGALGFILVSLGLILRANAKRVEANAKKIMAEAKSIETEANVLSTSAQAELAERQFIMDAHKRQITINDQLNERLDKEKRLYETRLADKEKKDESNYRVLSKVFDRHSQEIHDVLKKRFDRIDSTLAEIPSKILDGNKEWSQTMMGELAATLADLLATSMMAQEWYPFPDMNDPEWREEFVKPLVSKVRLYRRPVLSEASLTDAQILGTGETMEIIQGRKKGWLVRDKKSMYGWLPEHEVLTGLNAMKLSTNEISIVNTTNPVPVT